MHDPMVDSVPDIGYVIFHLKFWNFLLKSMEKHIDALLTDTVGQAALLGTK